MKEGDIVLMWSSYEGKEHPYISAEAIKWLAQLPIKMIGTEPSVEGEDPRSEEPGFSEAWATHRYALGNDIPIIDNPCNLKEIKKERVFFIGLPLRIAHLEASWIRAIALEPLS